MNKVLNVGSEIGRLRRVLLHRPGKEIENLVPEYLGKLLFDDIPYLEAARMEHDGFATILTENGVEVLYLEDLLMESLETEEKRYEFLKSFLRESSITSKNLTENLIKYLMDMSLFTMMEKVMSGIRKDEIKIENISSLTEILNDKYPFYLDPMPNLYFTRDPGAILGNGICINAMHTTARKRETFFLDWIFNHHSIYKSKNIPHWYGRDIPYSIEGGDILVLSPKIVAIGCSERTSAEAIEILAQRLFKNQSGFEKVLVFEIPSCRAFMHLDTVFTMVDYDKFTIHPGIEGPLNVYEITQDGEERLNFKVHHEELSKVLMKALKLPSVDLIRCGGGDAIVSGREQWNDGSNTLAISPGVVITYNRNYVTNEILTKKGIKVLTMPSAELSRGRGGPRCMSMPLYRDDL